MGRTEYRDWQPGDGLRCSFSNRTPAEVPCGKPVKTSVSVQDVGSYRDRTVQRPLCANHAPGGTPPHQVTVEARKVAHERLCTEHWDEYNKYYLDAIAEITSRITPH
jgi:hypothetical protein